MGRLKLLVLFGLCAFALAIAAIVVAGLNDELAIADLVVVPGNTVAADGTPSPRLKARLDVALKIFREHRAPRIFVSGGTGVEGFDEAVSMSDYLIKNGVPAQAIFRDSAGVDTAATARNAAHFMRAHGLHTAIVATQYFHVARTKLALERHGVKVAGTEHAPFFELRDLYSVPREAIGYAVYYLKS